MALALAGYLVAVDTGRRTMLEVWIDILVFAVVPLILVIALGLIIGLAVSALVWALFFFVRNQIRKVRHYTPPSPLENLQALNAVQRALIVPAGNTWWLLGFGAVFAVVSLVVDLILLLFGFPCPPSS